MAWRRSKYCFAIEHDEETKSAKTCKTCSLVLVILNSFEDVPSHFLTPSMRKPKVAVDEIVSLQTMYLKIQMCDFV